MTYFVTLAWLKAYTPVSANIDETLIFPFVPTSSDLWIQPILGTYFYEYLLNAYNTQTLNDDEKALVEKIKYAIAWRTASEAPIGLTFQLKNKGLQTQNSDNSESVDLADAEAVELKYVKKAEFYENQVKKYLYKNKDLFPEYLSDLNDDSLIKPSKDRGNDYNTFINFI
jgi:hypothetical protein